MYISMERNSRGNLEIEEKILNKIIEFDVSNNSKGIEKTEASVSLHHENTLFILIKLYVSNRDSLKIDESKLNATIIASMEKTLLIKPKNIAFAYIKK
ncbi:MMB_0454 family protein [Spiroplasma culicicola]|uniref:Uncharacterized protein n=1 Tax=Spiroplasma culicicola AES-1 TaxID=1276246 RepID=W6A7B1_9MOLU|nr:hypothetical protein [Spiroplasma culicicola]AHI52720.1 hypothetical protein SCULI_v1c03790 [Spiroplasma culicicola AES-1]